jgi:TPR repeat protein
MKWFFLADVQGDPLAEFSIGLMYQQGLGVDKSATEAAAHFQQAADQGYSKAQGNLGILYAQGEGVAQDSVQAYVWLTLAASGGDPAMLQDRDLVARKMTPAQLADAQKRAAEWQPPARK